MWLVLRKCLLNEGGGTRACGGDWVACARSDVVSVVVADEALAFASVQSRLLFGCFGRRLCRV